MKKFIYLDYAAATPLDPRVRRAMEPFLESHLANPSSMHTPGREARKQLEAARARLAGVLGAKPIEVILTSGSTEAANLAIMGVAQRWPRARVVATAIEHEAVLECVTALERQGRLIGSIAVGADGIVQPEQVGMAVDDTTVLVCVMYANNEIGTIQPIAKIATEIARIRADRVLRGITLPLYLYCDAAQAGMLNLKVDRLGVDLLSLGGSKIYGPRGGGFLYVRTGVELEPVIHGGGQERGLRSGTQNLPAAVGLSEALDLSQAEAKSQNDRQAKLRDELWRDIQGSIDNVRLNGDAKHRLSGNLNLTFDGAAGETLVAYLDREGIAVATGSACTAASEDPSHVLTAIGLTPKQAEQSLRITLGRTTTQAELRHFLTALKKVVPRVRELSAGS